jgi:nitrogenase cofactor biosynthesis protein NifB
MLSRTEKSFRQELYQKYYPGIPKAGAGRSGEEARAAHQEKSRTHPCFNGCGGQYARIHLPVAPDCNIQCNYCRRDFDCPNESRPGVTTKVLSPPEALERYRLAKEEIPHLEVVGIAGPGDALANFENTYQTLSLIRQEEPDITFCLSTNGLMLPLYADRLAELGVSHVTVTVNAVEPSVGARIYHHVDYMGQRYTGESAAAILMANQLAGIYRLRELGIICKVNIVMLKGLNDDHVPQVVEKVRALGCELTNIMQMIPVKGSAFERTPLTSKKEIEDMRRKCEEICPQMHHCAQCRADAVGTLANDLSGHYRTEDCAAAVKKAEPPVERRNGGEGMDDLSAVSK